MPPLGRMGKRLVGLLKSAAATPVLMMCTIDSYEPSMCSHVASVRSGPVRPFVPFIPWQRWQLPWLKIESPSASMAGVTLAGRPREAAALLVVVLDDDTVVVLDVVTVAGAALVLT